MRPAMLHGIFAFALGCLIGATTVTAAPSEQCDTETLQKMAPSDTTIAFAARQGNGCRADGYVTTNNPGPNKVLFMLVLPDNFNGRYLYLGVGGAAGELPSPPAELVNRGFAIAGSDGGTGAKSSADFSFAKDPAKALDYAWRGVKVSAAATQKITKTYYARNKIHRYISGCSGGGQMGLGNARRFGNESFDGFLVGATPFLSSLAMPNFYRIAQHLQTHPDGWIPPDLMAKAEKAILAAYDGTDGAVDGIIADQRNIAAFDTSILEKVGFTPAQIETFDLIRKPSRFPAPGFNGKGIYPGYSITAVSNWSNFLLGRRPPPWPDTEKESPGQLLASGVPYIHIMVDTRTRAAYPGLDYTKITDDKELVRIATHDGRDVPFDDPMDFSAMDQSGARMIVYHGVNDQSASYLDTLAGYEAVRDRFPNSANWLRAFVIPGMLHCRGGNGPSDVSEPLLDALVNWVEDGRAPESVTAGRFTKEKGLERNFLLCAEPMRARLKGADLDPNDAANWSCEPTDNGH